MFVTTTRLAIDVVVIDVVFAVVLWIVVSVVVVIQFSRPGSGVRIGRCRLRFLRSPSGRWSTTSTRTTNMHTVIGCLHDPVNVQQTSSKCIQNTRELLDVCWTFAAICHNGDGRLLGVCRTFAGSCKHPFRHRVSNKPLSFLASLWYGCRPSSKTDVLWQSIRS